MKKPLLLVLFIASGFNTLSQPPKADTTDIFHELDVPIETILQDKIDAQRKLIDSLKKANTSYRIENRYNVIRADVASEAVNLVLFLSEIEKKNPIDTPTDDAAQYFTYSINELALDFLPGKSIDTLLNAFPACKKLFQKQILLIRIIDYRPPMMASAPGIILPPLLSMGYTATTPYDELVAQARDWQSYIIEVNMRCKTDYNIDQYFSQVEPAKIKQVETKEKRKLNPAEKQKLLIDLRKKFATLIINRCQK